MTTSNRSVHLTPGAAGELHQATGHGKDWLFVFELLAAVLLSAQATDTGVNKATRRLFTVAHTPQQILALGQGRLEGYLRTIGLNRQGAAPAADLRHPGAPARWRGAAQPSGA